MSNPAVAWLVALVAFVFLATVALVWIAVAVLEVLPRMIGGPA